MNKQNGHSTNGGNKASASYHFRCYPEDKKLWRRAARTERLTLALWVVQTLNRRASRKRID